MSLEKTAKRILPLLICLFCYGCNPSKNPSKSSISKKHPNSAIEGFEMFFNKFQADSIFQKSRIEFPLKYTVAGDQSESDSTKFIPRSELNYIKLFISNRGKGVVKKTQLSPVNINIQFQITETGFEKDFTFTQKNGKWYLELIVDNSD